MRVLYVGFTAIGDADATGNTLKSLFSELAKFDFEVRQLSLDYNPVNHVNDVVSYYVSPQKSRLYTFLKSIYRNDVVKESNIEAFSDSKRIGGNPIVALARAFLDVLPKRYRGSDLKEIDEFKPEVIYTLGENISTLRKALYFSDRYQAPIVLHMMDNIEDCVYSYTPLTRLFRKRYLYLLKALYNRSVENIAISPKMAEKFSERHGCPFSYAMNSIETVSEKVNTITNNNLKMVFSGGMHAGRSETLSLIEKTIKKSEHLKNAFELAIFTSTENVRLYSKLFQDSSILHEYVPKEQMFSNLRSFDILLHVESFDAKEREFFKYSMSTKIPEYLSLGMPVVCVGPLDICTVSFLKETGAACVIDNLNELEKTLLLLSNDKSALTKYGAKAVSVARQEFLSQNVAKRLFELFERSINGYSKKKWIRE